MPVELTCVELEEFLSQDAVQKDGLSVWNFLDVVNSAAVSRGVDGESIGVAVEKVYREMVGNVLKEVRSSLILSLHLTSDRCPCDPSACVSGLSVEEGSSSQELDRALVLPEAWLTLVLRQRGLQRL